MYVAELFSRWSVEFGGHIHQACAKGVITDCLVKIMTLLIYLYRLKGEYIDPMLIISMHEELLYDSIPIDFVENWLGFGYSSHIRL